MTVFVSCINICLRTVLVEQQNLTYLHKLQRIGTLIYRVNTKWYAQI